MAKKKKLKDYFELGDLSASLVLKNLPFVLFLSFLILIYIANAHLSEKKVRQIQVLQKEIQEIRWHYMSIQSELMYSTRRTKVANSVADQGLRIPKGAPKKIVIPKKMKKK